MKRIARRIATVALATAAITLGAVGVASANAPGGSETCPSGAFCIYYNSWQYGWGSFAAYYPGQDSCGSCTFDNPGNGSGYGKSIWFNAAAIVNNTGEFWGMCTADQNHCEDYSPGEAGNVSPDIHNLNAYIFEEGILYA
jgi:hypothetical protein